jgi:stage II sporulation protein D
VLAPRLRSLLAQRVSAALQVVRARAATNGRALLAIARTVRTPCRAAACSIVIMGFVVSLVRCTTASPHALPVPEVQVLLDRDLKDARVASSGEFVVEDKSGRSLGSGKRLVDGRIRAAGPAFDLNGVSIPGNEMVLRSTTGEPLSYGGRAYPGDLRIRRGDSGRLEVANVVDIEEYVAGVLFAEMPSTFPTEALKAQAVAARTYARYRLDHGDPLLRATDADQVYDGSGPKFEQARALVAATRGVVLETGGRPICAYFMSTCGGATADGLSVFPPPNGEGLIGVECQWCRESPKYRWSRALPLAELERRLALPAGSIDRISARRDRFGHSLAFDVIGNRGTRTFNGQELRRLWNSKANGDAEKLPSSWLLSLEIARGSLNVEGAGFGHGVGMCQWGAAGLAAAGRDWRAILHHYYRAAEPVRRW